MSPSFRRARALLAIVPTLIGAACQSATVDELPPAPANASTPNGGAHTDSTSTPATPATPGTPNAVAGIRIMPRTITLSVGQASPVSVIPVDEHGTPSLA